MHPNRDPLGSGNPESPICSQPAWDTVFEDQGNSTEVMALVKPLIEPGSILSIPYPGV